MRAERARAIRDQLLFGQDDWVVDTRPGGSVASLEMSGVRAVLWNHYGLDRGASSAKSDQSPSKYPYNMDVWVFGERVLTFAWSKTDEIKLSHMIRGDWESSIFKLPPPSGASQPTIH